VDPHTHAHTTTGAVDSKFGFAAEQWGTVAQALSRRMFGLLGFHFHLGSPVYEVEPYQEAIRIVLRFVKTLKKVKKEWELQELSVGGGFAVSYVRERLAPPISYYAEGITKALIDGLKEHELPPPKLIIEPGRAVVGRAGVALYTVGARKDIPHVRTYIAVDGGLGDNIRPALYGARYEALVANRVEEEPKEMVTLAGRFCESGDVLVKDIPLPRTSPGDTVAIPAMGAYSIPMASNYNAAPRPAIVLVNKGKPVLWRRRESYEDLMAQDAG
jgi:diaminopimelate decarboxylase